MKTAAFLVVQMIQVYDDFHEERPEQLLFEVLRDLEGRLERSAVVKYPDIVVKTIIVRKYDAKNLLHLVYR